MKKLLPFLISLSIGSFSATSYAEDLMQVYQQAKQSNPSLLSLAAQRDSAYEKINESRGSLLPSIGLKAGYDVTKNTRGIYDGNRTNTTSGSISLSQSLFNMEAWKSLSITKKQAAIKDIEFRSEEQQLILDSATAYFGVLKALDAYSNIKAQKAFLGKQLDQTRERYKVGLVAITDVHDAQAQYDTILANEVTSLNGIDNALEELRKVSGVTYSSLSTIDIKKFQTRPVPAVNELLKESETNNLNLLSARLNQDISKEQIKLAQTGHYPTLSLSAGSQISDSETRYKNGSRSDSDAGSNSIGLSLNIPLYSGGKTSSQVKQAQYGYISYSEQLEKTYRTVTSTVRSAYNNIVATISTIKAYQRSVVSADSSLKATQAGYSVGTRTIVDVLNATTTLYDSKTKLSNARYDYLINILKLKAALGTLTENDLVMLNREIGETISVTSPK